MHDAFRISSITFNDFPGTFVNVSMGQSQGGQMKIKFMNVMTKESGSPQIKQKIVVDIFYVRILLKNSGLVQSNRFDSGFDADVT